MQPSMPLASVHVKELAPLSLSNSNMHARWNAGLPVASYSLKEVAYVLHRCHQCHKQVSLLLHGTVCSSEACRSYISEEGDML